MKQNSLMALQFITNASTYKNHSFYQHNYIDCKTGDFRSEVIVDQISVSFLEKGNSKSPVLWNESLYFLSDKTGLYQLYIYDFQTQVIEKLTNFKYGINSIFVQNQLIIETKRANKEEKIDKQLTSKQFKKLSFSMQHDTKVIDDPAYFTENGFTPFFTVYFALHADGKLTEVNVNKPLHLPVYESSNFVSNTNKKSIVILNNILRKEVLQYFCEKGFNIYCVNSLKDLAIDGKKYLFVFHKDLLDNTDYLKQFSKIVSFETQADPSISLGLTAVPITTSSNSLVTDWSQLASSSPIKKVDQIKKSLLLVHGRIDHAHPIEEAELLYSALKERNEKIDVKMLVTMNGDDTFFQNGNMKAQITLYDEIISWLKKGK